MMVQIVVAAILGVFSGPTFLPQQELTSREQIELRRSLLRKSVKVISSTGHGSGIVIKRLGEKSIILTNAHVISKNGSPSKSVRVQSGRTRQIFDADILFWAHDRSIHIDLAYLVVKDKEGLLGQPVPFAKRVSEGDFVIAVGNPLDETFLIDDGKVLRTTEGSLGTKTIYHDALIEHGSSGGGLFNSRGELVGINTYIAGDKKTGIAVFCDGILNQTSFSSTTVKANQGWADSGILVPKNAMTVRVLAKGRWNTSGFLGCNGGGMPGYENESVVPSILHASLIARVGSRGRVFGVNNVWKTGGLTKDSTIGFPDKIESGTLRFRINEIDKTIGNNSGSLDITVLIWAFAKSTSSVPGGRKKKTGTSSGTPSQTNSTGDTPYLGIRIRAVSDELRAYLSLEKGTGLILSKVTRGSPAENGGLKESDIIVSVNGRGASLKALDAILEQARPGQKITFVILRKGVRKSINVFLGIKD